MILVCFVFAIGTYATVTGVQNSILIQNVLAQNDGDSAGSGEGGGGRCTGRKEHGECQCANKNPCSDRTGCES